ncbi:hypothetical protein GCM10027447_38370 [Glycomyces halotolerans]
MSGHRHQLRSGSLEYELRCDRCGDVFRCGDDSYYSWPVLCAAAEAEGWRVRPGLGDEHECADCASRPGLLTMARDGGRLAQAA